MIQYELLNASPMSDTFANLYTKWNANFSIVPNEIVQTGNNVTFYNRDGDVFGEILLPLSPNVIISGLSASSVGFSLTVTGGDYQVANVLHTIGGTVQAIPAADLTFNRIDVLVVDNTGNYVYLTGVASANPVAPTITLNQLAVTYINIPAAGIPVITPNTCCIPNGTINGQTIRWNQSTNLWEINNRIISTNTTLYLRGDDTLDIGTSGLTNRSFINGDDFNLSLGVQNGLGVWNEFLISGSAGFDLIEGATESRFLIGCTGGLELISTIPSNTVNKLWNDAGSLYWNGDLVCTAPCGGGMPAGTLDFSTIRYDFGGGVWVENKFLLANDSEWTQICCALAPTTTYGAGNIATGLVFSQGANHTLTSRASVIMSCGQNIQLNHIPTLSDDGMNSIIGSHTVDINIHPDYKGLCTIIGSTNGGILHVGVPTSGIGQCLIFGSENMTINGELGYSGIINANDAVLNDTYVSGVAWSMASVLGTLGGSQTVTSGILFSRLGVITSSGGSASRCVALGVDTCTIDSGSTCGAYSSFNATIVSVNDPARRDVVIGSDNSTIDSGQVCGIYSCSGGNIKSYTGVGAVKCINSVILGGVSNTIDPTGTASCINVTLIGGSNNTINGGTGNATNSAIISSTNSNITPTGAGNRIILLGVDSVTAVKNNTTYVDNIDTQGSHTYSAVRHVTTNTYNVVAGDHIIGCLNTALFVTQTIYLPATPNEGDTYIIENPDGSAGGVGTITIDGNGNNVNGGLTVVLNTAYVSKTVRYYAGTVNAWLVGM